MSHAKQTVARFDVGRTLITRGAADTLHADDIFDAFVRHIAGDWGDVDAEGSKKALLLEPDAPRQRRKWDGHGMSCE